MCNVLGLPLGLEAPVMTLNSETFLFFSCAMLLLESCFEQPDRLNPMLALVACVWTSVFV